jgi:hypothetical protein
MPDGAIPFKISSEFRSTQVELIPKVFKIRATEMVARRGPVPFILFPELSIPINDPDGMEALHVQLHQAEGDIIFIGGLEGLNSEELHILCEKYPPQNGFAPQYGDGRYINICLIAIKAGADAIRWYYQAKLRPSPMEQNFSMALGACVLYFINANLSFLCQICFDQIATEGGISLNQIIYTLLESNATPNAAKLDFIFIPQFNEKPDHDSMKDSRKFLLNYRKQNFNSEFTTVININKAADTQESAEYGRSGLHYRSGNWQLIKNEVGPIGYELYHEKDVTSAIFRKRTSGIHITNFIHPQLNNGSAGAPRMPLENPKCYLITTKCDSIECACFPGVSCSSGVYVECYCLPCKLRDTIVSDYPKSDTKKRWHDKSSKPIQSLIDNYSSIRDDVLKLSSSRSREIMDMLLLMHSKEGCSNNPDLWKPSQKEAVIELFAALSTLKELSKIEFNTNKLFSVKLNMSTEIVFLDGIDKEYSVTQIGREYQENFEGQLSRPEFRKQKILLVGLRSSGSSLPPLVKCAEKEYYKLKSDVNKEGQPFTSPQSLKLFVCGDILFENARFSESISAYLKGEMRDVL